MSALVIPDGLKARYNFEQQPVAAALWKAYKTRHDGNGTNIRVPLAELLADLGKPADDFWKAELERVLRSIYQTHKIGYRFDKGTVLVWFTPEDAQRTRTYENTPDLTPFDTPIITHGRVFASLEFIDVQNLSVADMQDRLGPGHGFDVFFETVEGQSAITVTARGNAALKLSSLMIAHLGYAEFTQAQLAELAEVAA